MMGRRELMVLPMDGPKWLAIEELENAGLYLVPDG